MQKLKKVNIYNIHVLYTVHIHRYTIYIIYVFFQISMFFETHILLNNKLNRTENILFIIRYFKMDHNLCTPDIFNTKISHQIF